MDQKSKNRRKVMMDGLFVGGCTAVPITNKILESPNKIEGSINYDKDSLLTYKHDGIRLFGNNYLENESTFLVKPYALNPGEAIDTVYQKIKKDFTKKLKKNYTIDNTINRNDLEQKLFAELNPNNNDFSNIDNGITLLFPVQYKIK